MQPVRSRSWRDPAVVAVALAALMAGIGQFGAVAALGDVARSFGQVGPGTSVAEQAGLSGSKLGIGLAVIRLASLGALPLTGLADRFGRRRLLLLSVGGGLALTALAAASPGYWWFVAIFAAGRPALSTTNAVAEVTAAEQTATHDRAKAVALVAAGYGVGAGVTALVHSLGLGYLGFRGLFAFALLPLAFVPLLRRSVTEPDRFVTAQASDHPLPVLGAVAGRFRRRLVVVGAMAFTISVITGPATSFVFLYAQNVRHETSGVTAAMVVGAGLAGLVGLLVGRWTADHLGRRPSCAIGLCGLAGCGVLCYSGSGWAMITGYIAGVGAGSVLAPGVGSMVNEVFPTAVRASVLGWWIAAGVLGAAAGLVVFGAVADIGDQFRTAALVTFLPVLAAVPLFWMVPETRGIELEDLSVQEGDRATGEQMPAQPGPAQEPDQADRAPGQQGGEEPPQRQRAAP